MWHYIALAFALPPLYIVFATLQSHYNQWQYNRKAASRGCKQVPMRPYKYPGGLDLIKAAFTADKTHTLPTWFERTCFETMKGATTFRQYFFGSLVLMTTEPENIQAMLAKQFNDFELGPIRRDNFFPMLGNGIFTTDGEAWSHGRALLRPQFARNQVADLELEEQHVQDLLQVIPVDQSGWTDQINLQPLFFRFTLDSATEFLFGQSVGSQLSAIPNLKSSVPNPTGLNIVEVAKSFDRATHALGKRARFAEMYWLYNPKEFRDDCKLIHKFADFFVERALRNDIEKQGSRYVFADELAKATRDPVEIRSQLLNIFLAGRDTTAGLLGFMFFVFARRPEIFDKLRAAILEDFGTYEKPREITFASLKACSYLQNVMNETLRLYPSVPVNGRRATKDTTLPTGGGPDGKSPVFVTKGTAVDYSVHVMHRRKDLWGEDAAEFRPERWVNRKVGWEFLPFNGGPRICLGQQFALTEAGYVTVRMLQKFDKIENRSSATLADPLYQLTVTAAPWEVNLKLREAKH